MHYANYKPIHGIFVNTVIMRRQWRLSFVFIDLRYALLHSDIC